MDDKKRIAAEIRDHLARQRISREQFAFQTKLGKSTVDKLLTGLFSDRTLAIVEGHTGLTLRERPGAAPAAAAAETMSAPDRPSIAVLPFTYFGDNPEQDYLADGITEDVITALARLRWLFVIARNSSFVYKGRAVDVRQVSRELGVRYVLEGSVRTAGGRIRITSQLIDAESGKHIWAEKYDRELRDVFAVLDEITEQVVAAVEPHLYAEEGFRAGGKQPESIDAWGLVVRALSLTSKVDQAQNEEAQVLLRRAIEMDPDLCARSRAAQLGDLVGCILLLDGSNRWLQPGLGACRGGVGDRFQRSVGPHDGGIVAQPTDAARTCVGRTAERAATQPELCARPHGARLGADARRPIRCGRR